MKKSALVLLVFLAATSIAIPSWSQQEKADLGIVSRIRYERLDG